jgi:hypothetical protein
MDALYVRLFELIGGARMCYDTEYGKDISGLCQMPITDFEQFMKRHLDASLPDLEFIFTQSIEKALVRLEGSVISRHKMSCACLPYDVPRALSIYYKSGDDHCNLILPGIGYLASEIH